MCEALPPTLEQKYRHNRRVVLGNTYGLYLDTLERILMTCGHAWRSFACDLHVYAHFDAGSPLLWGPTAAAVAYIVGRWEQNKCKSI